MASMTNSLNFGSYLEESDLTFQGIFVHPSHLSPTGSFSSETISYMDEDVNMLSMSSDYPNIPASPTRSSSSSFSEDYFSSTFHHQAQDSPLSSACSTPTPQSLKESTNTMNRSNATVFPSTFSFTNHHAANVKLGNVSPMSQSTPLPQYQFPVASTSSSSMVASTSRGAAMTRSFSTPVETQRQLDQRKLVLSAVAEKMESTAGRVGRAKSSAGLELLGTHETRFGAISSSSGMERTPSSFPGLETGAFYRPTPSPFGDGWGAALPERAIEVEASTPFPYNLHHSVSRPMQTRLSRSLSALVIPSPVSHSTNTRNNSLPGSGASSPSSAIYMKGGRGRRSTFMTPLTPISSSTCALLPVHELAL